MGYSEIGGVVARRINWTLCGEEKTTTTLVIPHAAAAV